MSNGKQAGISVEPRRTYVNRYSILHRGHPAALLNKAMARSSLPHSAQ